MFFSTLGLQVHPLQPAGYTYDPGFTGAPTATPWLRLLRRLSCYVFSFVRFVGFI